MRPRSIVAPLVLIALGLLFLFHNLLPDVRFLDLASRYWPLLLIGWGFIRLVEVLMWHNQGKQLPVSAISGGEWAAAVLICLIGSMAFWGSRYASHWPAGRITLKGLEIFGEAYDFPVSAAKTVGKTPKVVLELGRGNARVVGKDTDQIQITGRKTIRSFDQGDADRADKDTPLEIVFAGDQAIIRTNQDRLGNSRRASSDLEITVPKGSTFEGRGRYGDFDVSEISGNVEITSDNAGVRVQGIGGAVRADLKRSDVIRATNVKGPVEIKGRGQDLDLDSIEGQVTVNGEYTGELAFRNLAKPLRFESSRTEVRVEKTPGQVRIALGNITAERVQGPVKISTRSRDVQVRDFADGLDLDIERGDIELRPSAQMGRMEVKTNNGNVDLVLPAGTRFDIAARTKRGEISNEYGAPLEQQHQDRGAVLKGATGQGPSIGINVDRGSITVRKAVANALVTPPAPPAPVAPPAPATPFR